MREGLRKAHNLHYQAHLDINVIITPLVLWALRIEGYELSFKMRLDMSVMGAKISSMEFFT